MATKKKEEELAAPEAQSGYDKKFCDFSTIC